MTEFGRGSIKILVPRLYNQGGVANYYQALQGHLGPEYEYIFRGKVSCSESRLAVFRRLIKDYKQFFSKTDAETKIIVLNPSLEAVGFFRDGLYLLLAPGCVRKVVFFRGWNTGFEKKITESVWLRFWLNKTFLRADHIIALSSKFKETIRQWGFRRSVSIGSTIVDENLLGDDDIKSLQEYRGCDDHVNMLYLGNISRAKGVWEVLNAYRVLCDQKALKKMRCVLAGEGSELEMLKEQAKTMGLDIEFPGYVRGKQKASVFRRAHFYVFPSAHHEGMPNSVLEAMAFGLPVITTRVSGVADFFEDGKMGFFLDNRDSEHIAEKISFLLARPCLMRQISEFNYFYAKEHFYSHKVAEWFKRIVESTVLIDKK